MKMKRSFTKSYTNLSYLLFVPNFRNKKQFELQKPISQLFNALKTHFKRHNSSGTGTEDHNSSGTRTKAPQ